MDLKFKKYKLVQYISLFIILYDYSKGKIVNMKKLSILYYKIYFK